MFLLFRIANMADGTIRKSVYDYKTKDEVLANFHTYLGVDIKDANVLSILCLATASNGEQIAKEYWQGTGEVVAEPTE